MSCRSALWGFPIVVGEAFYRRGGLWPPVVFMISVGRAAKGRPYRMVHRPVAPQGRARPLSVTGRPSSSETVCPPNFLEIRVSRM